MLIRIYEKIGHIYTGPREGSSPSPSQPLQKIIIISGQGQILSRTPSRRAMAAVPFLRLAVGCRKLTAQVTVPETQSIVAMASSTEADFLPQYRAKINRIPRTYRLWDANIAARVGENLGRRLREIGVDGVQIDVPEEVSRPPHFQKMVRPLFDSVQLAGVRVFGSEKLQNWTSN